MGRNGVVLSFEQRNENGVRYGEAKVDLGGGNVITATYCAPAGVDSWPLPGDVAALENSAGSGAWQATGFLDTKITPLVANSGEVAFYSRSAPGVIAASVLMKAGWASSPALSAALQSGEVADAGPEQLGEVFGE